MCMNNMIELRTEELICIEGGWNWGLVLGGAALVVTCIGVAGAAPVSLPILAAGALCAASGLGGAAIGTGFVTN